MGDKIGFQASDGVLRRQEEDEARGKHRSSDDKRSRYRPLPSTRAVHVNADLKKSSSRHKDKKNKLYIKRGCVVSQQQPSAQLAAQRLAY